ncbi:MAG: VCBS repeat-containing protein [Planctomycetes bacterium]|nr:VCBS repeat-containing protein [Planctomycetota bacterium]
MLTLAFLLPLLTQSLPTQEAPDPNPGNGQRFGRCIVALSDLDGDGQRELAVGMPFANAVLVHSGAQRDVIQTWKGGGGFGNTLAHAGDVNGDGIPDVLVGYADFQDGLASKTDVCSGKDGVLLWRYERMSCDVAGLGDLDRDGCADLALVGEDTFQVRSGKTGKVLAQRVDSGWRSTFWLMGDYDRDGVADALQLDPIPGVLYSARPNKSQTDSVPESLYPLQAQAPLVALCGPAVEGRLENIVFASHAGDWDRDGQDDVFLITKRDAAYEASVYSGSFQRKPLAAIPLSTLLTHYTQTRPGSPGRIGFEPNSGGGMILSADLNGDGTNDLVWAEAAMSFMSHLTVYSGLDGKVLWERKGPVVGGKTGLAITLYDDYDEDGTPDILVGSSDWILHGPCYEGDVQLLSGKSGLPLWKIVDPAANR